MRSKRRKQLAWSVVETPAQPVLRRQDDRRCGGEPSIAPGKKPCQTRFFGASALRMGTRQRRRTAAKRPRPAFCSFPRSWHNIHITAIRQASEPRRTRTPIVNRHRQPRDSEPIPVMSEPTATQSAGAALHRTPYDALVEQLPSLYGAQASLHAQRYANAIAQFRDFAGQGRVSLRAPRPREPDRRTHRLQSWLRHAHCPGPRHSHRRPPTRRPPSAPRQRRTGVRRDILYVRPLHPTRNRRRLEQLRARGRARLLPSSPRIRIPAWTAWSRALRRSAWHAAPASARPPH